MTDKDEEMHDVGYDGGFIGPLEYVETQYGTCIELSFATGALAPAIELFLDDGFFVYDGSFYAHFTAAYVTGEHL